MSHVFRHPKYYQELRKKFSLDPESSDKQQATSSKPQASSDKPQAASIKQEPQATSGKHPNPDAMVPASGHRKQES